MRWEYFVFGSNLSDPKAIQDRLDKAGDDGWELVSVVKEHSYDGDKDITLFLKKPL